MKTTKQKLVLLGTSLLLCTLVVGDIRFSQFIYPLLWVYFPILVFPLFSKLRTRIKISLKLVFGTIYVLASFIFLLRFFLCGYGPSMEKYVSTANNHFRIVGRDFSCYGTTGDLILYKQFSISKNVKIETYYKTLYDYQRAEIDTAKWKRIDGY